MTPSEKAVDFDEPTSVAFLRVRGASVTMDVVATRFFCRRAAAGEIAATAAAAFAAATFAF